MTKKDFFSILLFVLGLVLAVLVFRASGEKIELAWDSVDDVDGYRLFQAIRAADPETGEITHEYDFAQPITTESYPDGNIPQNVSALTVDLPGQQNADTKYMFVARSYRGDETSANSNEVSYVVSLVAPFAAVELSGSYDKDQSVVTISWNQPPDEYEWRMISHWIVYYRIAGTEEWQAIGRIDADHVLEMTAPFDAVASGEQTSVEFTIVSYRRSGVYSANSEILTLDIDRREVPPVQKLRINIEIPVT